MFKCALNQNGYRVIYLISSVNHVPFVDCLLPCGAHVKFVKTLNTWHIFIANLLAKMTWN